jgi:hypothetical protein
LLHLTRSKVEHDIGCDPKHVDRGCGRSFYPAYHHRRDSTARFVLKMKRK